MYGELFCRVYNELGWNYYPEAFGEQLLLWMERNRVQVRTSLDLACGTGVLCEILHSSGVEAWGMDLSAGMIAVARERNPKIHYEVADMTAYRPDRKFDLVTCTGDAVNHIAELSAVEQAFRNVYDCLEEGGWFIFDILNENEVSGSEPFEMDFTDTVRVWFQMTRPTPGNVNLKIRVYEKDELALEENIVETVHDPGIICQLLEECGFQVCRCSDRLMDDQNPSTTWFVIAKK